MGLQILCVTSQRVGPQSFAILPIRGLLPGASHQAGHEQRASDSIQPASRGPVAKKPLDSPTHSPDEGNAQTNLRQVGVTIGPGMISDRHQPNHGHQRAEVPQPADQQCGLFPPQDQGGHGNSDQDYQGGSHLPGRKRFWTRIKGSQPDRPKELAEVDSVGDQDVGDPCRDWRAPGAPRRCRPGSERPPRSRQQPEPRGGSFRPPAAGKAV